MRLTKDEEAFMHKCTRMGQSLTAQEGRNLLAEVDALRKELTREAEERLAWANDVLRIASALKMTEYDGHRVIFGGADLLIEEVERLRRLPVVATCGGCSRRDVSDGACLHVDVPLNNDDKVNGLHYVGIDSEPPDWCPLRGAK